MTAVFDPTPCLLGEGPLWHPLRQQLFWFDIAGRKLLSRADDTTRTWSFDEHVSAAGWIDEGSLLVASQTALFSFDIETGARQDLANLEADNPVTRSNDGRADPWGGFWIGTMGLQAEAGAGAIYRFYRGELRKLYGGLTIPNAISFDPEGTFACYCDTREHVIRKQRLHEADGWPAGDSEIFIDMTREKGSPDGAVIDADGRFWNAQWGAGRVAAYGRDGAFLRAVKVAAPKSTCPAFGGADLATLFVTTACEDMDEAALAAAPESGMTFAAEGIARGQAEHRVIL